MPILSLDERTALEGHHTFFSRKASTVSKTAVLGIFLLIISVIVVMGSSLCLTLPGINVMRSVILPGLLPGGIGLLISIPLLVVTVKLSIQKTARRKVWLNKIKECLNTHEIEKLQEKEQKAFIEREILPANTSRDYKEKLISEIKALYPKQKTPEQEKLITRLDEITASLYPQKKNKDED